MILGRRKWSVINVFLISYSCTVRSAHIGCIWVDRCFSPYIKNVFVKPDEVEWDLFQLCHGEKTRDEIQRIFCPWNHIFCFESIFLVITGQNIHQTDIIKFLCVNIFICVISLIICCAEIKVVSLHPNVFVKPNEQSETCFSSAMARKRETKSDV